MSLKQRKSSTDVSPSESSIKGMTLLELMFVVVIIGVMAIFAYPSFNNQILISRRGDGVTQLLQLKIQQEAFRLENISYASTTELSLPVSEYYKFSVSNESATAYTLTATAINGQVEDTQCINISIDQSMLKTPKECF
ncbi:type IV pilin protein [uncultured Paraglaciecola sp.]|uniref:type IV pilin protein n=1 Tax=uncultured Paraglaciecola sp. TaxID=1765024 RepID=UPI00259662F9|nr:type IV pilin protein [uncultured Paraglaciecola sp.]